MGSPEWMFICIRWGVHETLHSSKTEDATWLVWKTKGKDVYMEG